jgi:hypothetical protein
LFQRRRGVQRRPGAAAVALARLGYEVVLMPERFRPMLCLWRDDFLEASKRVNGSSFAAVMREADKMMDEVNDIVDRFGGHCVECGYVPDEHIPGFFGLVEEERRNPA